MHCFHFTVLSIWLSILGLSNGNENITWKCNYFICATSRLFQLAQFLQKSANYPGTKLVGVADVQVKK